MLDASQFGLCAALLVEHTANLSYITPDPDAVLNLPNTACHLRIDLWQTTQISIQSISRVAILLM
jgi:hypothetical protein